MFLVVSYDNFSERFYNTEYNNVSKQEAVEAIMKEDDIIINIIDL